MKHDENGFVTPALLIVTVSLCIILSGISFMLFSRLKKIESIQKSYNTYNEMSELLEQMIVDFQSMKDEENDCVFSSEKSAFLSKYADFNLTLEDVSTGLFEENLNENFLKKESIKNLLSSPESIYRKNYGWFNERIAGNKKIEKLRADFSRNNLLPFVNQIPYYNVNVMDVDFLEAVLMAKNIKDSKKRAEEIYNTCGTGEMTVDELKRILKVNDSSDILQLIGLKTVFWSMSFENENYFCKAIAAGIPGKDLDKIDKYILIERHIEKKELNNE